jgi:hypothetical protein
MHASSANTSRCSRTLDASSGAPSGAPSHSEALVDNPVLFTIVVCWFTSIVLLVAWTFVAKPVVIRESAAEAALYYGFLVTLCFPFLVMLVGGAIAAFAQ